MPNMNGKKVIVTGSDTGIGRGIALEFARCGADVVLHYPRWRDMEVAVSAVEEIKRNGGKATAYKADFTRFRPVRQFAENAIKYLGGLDIIVNNAGITMDRPIEEVTPEQYDTLYNVNVRAPYFLIQAALPALRESGHGAIINLASCHAFRGRAGHSVYAGTKGAIVAFTRELAIELAPQNIRVNAIAPGAVPVENHYQVVPNYNVEDLGKLLPLGHAQTPMDIGKVAVWLASEDSRYITGQTVIVDSGMTSGMELGTECTRSSGLPWGKGYVPGIE